MIEEKALAERLGLSGRTTVSGVLEGLDAMAAAQAARRLAGEPLIHVALDDQRMASLAEALAFFAADVEVIAFPAWDCLPYDRVSPAANIVARRLAALALIAVPTQQPRIVLTSVNAVLQRLPQSRVIAETTFSAAPGQYVDTEKLQLFLQQNGYSRTGTVVDAGDFAIRGGIIDIYPPGAEGPVRLDFFGDALETVRRFDPQSQRSTGTLRSLVLHPASEVLLTPQAIGRFRTSYAAAFGGLDINDPLYESVTNGRRYQGMEHWLPLFHEKLETIFDHVGEAAVSLDHSADEAVSARLEQIAEFHDARREALNQETFGAAPYKPLKPDALYLTQKEWSEFLADRSVLAFTPFETPDSASTPVLSMGGRQGRNFAAERGPMSMRRCADTPMACALPAKGSSSRHGRKDRPSGWKASCATMSLPHSLWPTTGMKS